MLIETYSDLSNYNNSTFVKKRNEKNINFIVFLATICKWANYGG